MKVLTDNKGFKPARGTDSRAASRASLDAEVRREAATGRFASKKSAAGEDHKDPAEGYRPTEGEQLVTQDDSETPASAPTDTELVHPNDDGSGNDGPHAAASEILSALPAEPKDHDENVSASQPSDDTAEESLPPEPVAKRKSLTDEGWDFFSARYPAGMTRRDAALKLGVPVHQLSLRPRRYYALMDGFNYLSEKMGGRQLGPKEVAVVVDFAQDGQTGKYNVCTCSNEDCKARFFEVRFADVLHAENQEFRETFERVCQAGGDVDLVLCARHGNLKYRGPRYLNPSYDRNAPISDKDASRRWLTLCGAPLVRDVQRGQMVFDNHSCLGLWGQEMGDLETARTGVTCDFFFGRTIERAKRHDAFEAHNDSFVVKKQGGLFKLLKRKGQAILTTQDQK